MAFEKFVRLYVEYKSVREGNKVISEYKPSEADIEAAKIADQYPEHLLRAAVVMSSLDARKKIRESNKKPQK